VTTVNLPNYLLENKNAYQLIYDKNFIVAKSSLHKKTKTSLRNSTHMIIILIKGSKVLHMHSGDITIDTNDIIFLSQGNYFMSEIINLQNNFESILICFDDDFILDFIQNYDISIDTKYSKSTIKIKQDYFMQECITIINSYFLLNVENKIDLLKLKTREIFLYTLSKEKALFLSFLKNIIRTKPSRVKYILESNLDIIHSVKDMAKLTRLSDMAIRKEIFNLYGEKPKVWLDKKRLHQATILLKHSNHSISNISTTCGYSNTSWFIRQFKKYYKITPYLYRKENLHK